MELTVSVPGNSKGMVHVPAPDSQNMSIEGEGRYEFQKVNRDEVEPRVVYEVGPGLFYFQVRNK